MTVDEVSCQNDSVDKMTVDEVSCQNDSVDKMTDDAMSVDKMIAVRMTVIRQDDSRKYDRGKIVIED